LTFYMHLSKIEVKAGYMLGKGDRLGLCGETGRVTGPHLHMGVRWNGAYLDPTMLLRLTLPRLGREKRRTATRARHTARTRPLRSGGAEGAATHETRLMELYCANPEFGGSIWPSSRANVWLITKS
jgi:hypothetical protein